MARYGSFLYRRNARYYARLRIPARLREFLGRTHVRVSLRTSDYEVARLRVHETVLAWKRHFSRLLNSMDPLQVVAGSPLLHGEGQLTLASAAHECGLTLEELLQEVRNRRVEVRAVAQGWWGCEMGCDELEFDWDGSFITNSADGHVQARIAGLLYVRREAIAAASGDRLQSCLFFRDRGQAQAVVIPPPGVELAIGDLLIDKADAEAIRVSLAGTVTPTMVKLATASLRSKMPAVGHAPSSVTTAPVRSSPKASELVARYLKAKDADWSPATRIAQRAFCDVFVEVMADPPVDSIDKALLSAYRTAVTGLPSPLHLARRDHPGASSLAELAKLSARPRISAPRAAVYVAKIGEAFSWAVDEGLMKSNPAAGLSRKKQRRHRKQDERDAFTPENLRLIFSVDWFATGKGERTAQGKHWGFQPHMYWLPLLALYAGGRLNELSQLYLADIKQTESGCWYLDFNLNTPDKLDVDQDDGEPEVLTDKRLKTVNAVREVPLHGELLRLGFVEYVQALASRGEKRVFPELRFDRVKGYGKQAGQWFNERFLGKRLKIKRDGMQTFHSFRHNFTTALMQLGDPPLSEFVTSHLTGHERGRTMAGQRYAKDTEPDKMLLHVNRLRYDLPPIAAFDVEDGLLAVEAALDRKAALRRA